MNLPPIPSLPVLGAGVLILFALTLLLPLYLSPNNSKALQPRSNHDSTEKTLAAPPLPPSTEILDIRIYPIKSCRGFSVPAAAMLSTGLDLDRNWMFVSLPKREFITIRGNSRMTLIDTSYNSQTDELEISISGHHKDTPPMKIPAHPTRPWLETNTQLGSAEIWGQKVDAWEYPASLTSPIQEFLDQGEIRLVYKGPTPRELRGSGDVARLGREASTKFADMLPVQVSSMASMRELNTRLKKGGNEELSIERFRPNIVVRGDEPWNEDSWKTIRIRENGRGGDDEGSPPLLLDVACRCLRCQVPNVDPDTAEKDAKQPWDTLMSYRRIDKGYKYKPGFGMLCVPRDEALGEVKVGMKFDVTEMTANHFFVSPMK